jgi:predicted SAM-dependent methyltransferase
METTPVIKLNLGCGNKFIRDYVNVDIVIPEGDLPKDVPFVQDNVLTLNTFEDSSVDEIVAFHVIEHIPVYNLEDTLLRWYDVLKPGGRVVVELPCIIKSCINLLQIYTTKESQIFYNLGLKGIFGDPHPENTFMEHKWGWTFETLAQQFRNAGFEFISEETPVTHMGPVRDFRLVAYKSKENANEHCE